jgi:cytochrome c556
MLQQPGGLLLADTNEKKNPWRARMKIDIIKIAAVVLALTTSITAGQNDRRQLVEMPEPMQSQLLSDMRGRLEATNEILQLLSIGELDKAADQAENHLGMSSVRGHGTHHWATYMPSGMRQFNTQMATAASQFAQSARKGELLAAYATLAEITKACAFCHAAYRIR